MTVIESNMVWIALFILALLVVVLATRFVELQREVQNLVEDMSGFATLEDIDAINAVRRKVEKNAP